MNHRSLALLAALLLIPIAAPRADERTPTSDAAEALWRFDTHG
ncbi:MAG TPA: hypothetical protein VIL97_03955 [Thermoanaerobaculia bacterium]